MPQRYYFFLKYANFICLYRFFCVTLRPIWEKILKNTHIQMQTTRFCFDRIMRAGIKLAMLTGVAFTVTACYGVPQNGQPYYEDEEYQTDTQQVEQQLVVEEENITE